MLIFTALMGVRLMMVTYKWLKSVDRSPMLGIDVFLTLLYLGFAIGSLIRRHVAKDTITGGIINLVNCFLQVTDVSNPDIVAETVNTYLMTLDVIASQVLVEHAMKLLAYALVLLSIVRVIAYMSVHPRIDVIARTITYAADDMFHFMLVFIFVFAIFAWLAFWSFGPDKEPFQTYLVSLNSCFQMLVGEYPWTDEWTESWTQKVWWMAYTFLVFFVSVNVLLAIIIEAFLRVTKQIKETNASANVLLDLGFLAVLKVVRIANRWPNHTLLLRHCKVTELIQHAITPEELATSRFARFRSAASAEKMLNLYYRYLGPRVLGERGQELLRKKKELIMTTQFAKDLFGLSGKEVEKVMARIVQIQRVFRMKIAWRRADRKLKRAQRKADAHGHALSRMGSMGSDASGMLKATSSLLSSRSKSFEDLSGETPTSKFHHVQNVFKNSLGMPDSVAQAWFTGKDSAVLQQLVQAASQDLAVSSRGSSGKAPSKWRADDAAVEVDLPELNDLLDENVNVI